MDSEKVVRWFAETVLGATLHETKWGYKSYHVTGGGVHDLLALPRDLNAVHEPACRWLRETTGGMLNLLCDDEGGFTADVVAHRNKQIQPLECVTASHPAEAIIGLCWEVGHA